MFSDSSLFFPREKEYVMKLRANSKLYIQNVISGVKEMRKMEWDEILGVEGNTLFIARQK
jgi:hypothetical protein